MVYFLYVFLLLILCIIKVISMFFVYGMVALLIHGVVYQVTGVSIYNIFYNRYIKNLLIY